MLILTITQLWTHRQQQWQPQIANWELICIHQNYDRPHQMHSDHPPSLSSMIGDTSLVCTLLKIYAKIDQKDTVDTLK
jgi:hypothetical protein